MRSGPQGISKAVIGQKACSGVRFRNLETPGAQGRRGSADGALAFAAWLVSAQIGVVGRRIGISFRNAARGQLIMPGTIGSARASLLHLALTLCHTKIDRSSSWSGVRSETSHIDELDFGFPQVVLDPPWRSTAEWSSAPEWKDDPSLPGVQRGMER